MEDETKFERIKRHFKERKDLYIGIGVGIAITGITCVIMRERYVVLHKGANGQSRATVRSFFFSLTSKNSGNIVTAIHTGDRGHPGFRVKNLEHGIKFDTQGQAARAFGVPENVLSLHLNNRIPDANGYHFERIVP